MKLYITLLISLSFLTSNIFCQEEVLIYPETNTGKMQLKSSVSSTDVPENLLTLPFYDDFAYPAKFPDSQKWYDNYALINNHFTQKCPTTIGIATLDALNEIGRLYSNASVQPFSADVLTSLPINLKNYLIKYRSDLLFEDSVTDNLISNVLYLFDSKTKSFKSASDGFWITAADTLYTYNNISGLYDPYLDSVYYLDINSQKRVVFSDFYNKQNHIIDFKETDSVILSFQYQAGGIGDMPESDDVLYLEFFAPSPNEGIFINEITKTQFEIYNATETKINLKGYYFSTKSSTFSSATSKIISNDIIVYPYKYIGLDMMSYFGTDSVSKIYLFDDTKQLIDSFVTDITFSAEYSLGRMPDGASTIKLVTEQTIGDVNPNWDIMQTLEVHSDLFLYRKVHIYQSKYLRKGFRFRFRNMASLSNDLSHARNEDMWNIDDVWLDYGRGGNENYAQDVSYITDLGNLLNGEYRSFPSSHLVGNLNDFVMNIPYNVVNKDNTNRSTSNRFSIRHITSKDDGRVYSMFDKDILSNSTISLINNFKQNEDDEHNIYIPYDKYIDSTLTDGKNEYEVMQYFTDYNGIGEFNKDFRWNDTIRSSIVFDNYYAYDDGSSEAGYGIRESSDARVAYKFTMNIDDTLRGAYIFFNHTLYSSTIYYQFCVWTEKDGYPDEMIVKKYGLKVQKPSQIDGFTFIKIEPEDILNDSAYITFEQGENFFVGWQQTQDVLINVGVDLNSPVGDKIYYNTSYQWFSSSKKIALMIRPVICKEADLPSSDERPEITVFPDLVLFPNPASDILYIKSSEKINPEDNLIITDLLGNIVFNSPMDEEFDISSLQEGLYFVTIRNSEYNVSRKLMIRR